MPTALAPCGTRTRSSCSGHGEILERGTHDQLIAANGAYARLYAEFVKG